MPRTSSLSLSLLLLITACDAGDDPSTDDTDVGSETDTDPVAETDPTTETDPVHTDTDTTPPDPDPMTVTMSPEAPLPGDALACTADTHADVTWSWVVDGRNAGILTHAVPEGTTLPYETWTCFSRTVDGLFAGEASVQVGEACTSFEGDGEGTFLISDAPVTAPVDVPFTLEMWVWRARTGVEEDLFNHVGLFGDDPPVDAALRFTADDELLFLTSKTPDDDCARIAVDAPTSEAWHHVAASWDPVSGRKLLYVDGHLERSCMTRDRPAAAVNGVLIVGGRIVGLAAPTHLFEGFIDEIRLSTVERRTGLQFTPTHWYEPDADTAMLLHLNEATGTTPPLETPDAASARVFKFSESVTGVSDARSACDTRTP